MSSEVSGKYLPCRKWLIGPHMSSYGKKSYHYTRYNVSHISQFGWLEWNSPFVTILSIIRLSVYPSWDILAVKESSGYVNAVVFNRSINWYQYLLLCANVRFGSNMTEYLFETSRYINRNKFSVGWTLLLLQRRSHFSTDKF